MNIPSNFFDSQSSHSWTTNEQKKDDNSESNQLQIEGIDKGQREEIHKISYKPKSNYTHGQDKRGNLCDEEHLKGLDNPLVSIIREQAKSVACMIFSEQLEELDSGEYQLLDKTTLAKRMENVFDIPFGEKEVFRDEPAPGFGTAFFIGGKFALTAGHCVCLSQRNKKYSCVKNQECVSKNIANTKLVFHFKMEEKNRSKEIFAKGDVYEIEKVVCHAFTKIKDKDLCESEWEDWAIIELKEEVKGREPLNLNCFKKVAKKINLYMLGHPSGLPVKLTKDGCVKNDAHPKYFTCDLDAFSGNSGSPVFNREKPHEVVGILCGGGDDYEITNNYKGTGQKRVQTHHVTVGFEKCQRVSSLLIELERCGIFKVRPPPEETKINQFLNSLKNSYTRNKEISQLLYKKEKILELIDKKKEIPSEPTLPIDAIYTQLVLIEKDTKESDNEKKELEINGLAEINGWESIQGSKKAIALDQLFEKSEGQKEAPKTLLILGKAGVGKSTLCHHIARQWAKGKLWNDKFDALFWVPLRQLQNSDSNVTAMSFLFRHCCQGTHELYPSEIANYIKNNNDKILFVLDGYDEIDQMHKKIVDELQENSHWIITSRPYAAQNLKADAMIENIGFTSETIESYIHKLFLNNKEKAEIALQAIRQNSLIFNICHIPINLELISTIIENQIEENNRKKNEEKNKVNLSSIQSMSDLYQTLTLTLQKRFLKKIGKINTLWTSKQGEIDRISEEENIDQFQEILDSEEISPIFEFLESAAFIAMKNKELLFSFNKGSLKKLYQQYSTEEKESFRKNIPHTRFIHCSTSDFYAGQHSFIHLTFQEFFAARHLVRLLQSQERRVEVEQAIKEIKFNPRYKVVIWFVAGLLKNDTKNLHAFFDLLDEPKDPISLYSAMLKVRCLEECEWSKAIEKNTEYEE